MTVTNAKSQRPARRPLSLRACALGVALGLYAAAAGALPVSTAAVTMAQSATGAMADPAKRLPGAVTVSAIDFKRGDGGSGKLILRFSGDGAAPDLRTMGSSVVVDIGNAQLPASLQRPIDVKDFATPVQRIDAHATSNGTQLVLGTKGTFESMAYQSGNEYIVEVVPRAAPVASTSSSKVPAMGAAAMGATTSNSAVRYTGKAVTFNFQDVPVRTVLQLIAEESNLNIVAADTVQGNVTLRLINVPWDQALDIVLQAKSLDKRSSGNVVWVAPQKEIAQFEQDKADARINMESRADKVTEYIPVNYGSAEDIANLLTEGAKGSQGGGAGGGAGGGQQDRGFLSQRGSISFDKRTNTLLVIDIPERVANIRDLVSKLDKPVDQVVIEARIVIANENVARELGAKFGISGSTRDGKNYFSNSIANNIATQNSLVTANSQNSTIPPPVPAVLPTITRGLMSNLPATLAGAGSLALSILNAGYALDVELSAIQAQGRGEVISNPRIVTSSQKEAVIRQGKEIGYLTVTGGQSNSVPTVQFKEALLELKVTPTITNDGRVFMNLAIKKDDLDGFINVGSGLGQVPQIAKRELNTAVLIDDGQTVVIGGVYEINDRTDISKIPFLGDIPFLGNLFRNKNHTKSKAELLIFVTPKVMRVAQRN
ncbi:MAG: type IV pilus secretin PilQ [Thermomonas sp.]